MFTCFRTHFTLLLLFSSLLSYFYEHFAETISNVDIVLNNSVYCFQDCLQPLSMQALPAQPESLCIVEMGGVEKQDELGEKGTIGFLYLNIGLQVFFLIR